MVAYGTTRDPNLTPYMDAGFWIAGQAPVERGGESDTRIAYVARFIG
jgi:hypothetical protein